MRSYKLNPFLSIKGKLLIFAFSISLIPIITITFVYYLNARKALKQHIVKQLRASAESKRLHVLSLMETNDVQTRNYSSDGYIRNQFELITRRGASNENLTTRLNTYLARHKLPLYRYFIAILLVDDHGRVISSSNEELIGTDITYLDVFQEGIKKGYGETFIGQPHYSSHLKANCILISAPLISRQGNTIGVIINAYNLAFLNEITMNHAGMGESVEIYLLNKDNIMITESRFKQGTSLKQEIQTAPILKIIKGDKETAHIYSNYMNIPVIGISVDMPEYNWKLVSEIEKTEAFASLRLLGMVALILGTTGSIAVIGIGIVFAVSVSNPIKMLTEATKWLTSGELNHRVTIKRSDEIGKLAWSFNTMAEELKKEINEHKRAEEALIKSNNDLHAEITERKRIEDELRKQRDHLEYLTTQLTTANRELESFCYSVSHDLRSPLRSMDGFSKALLEDYPDKLDTQGKNYLHRICAASHHMGQLIDDLLALSRTTRATINYKTVNLSALVKTIVADLMKKEPNRKIRFVATDGLTAHGDPQLLTIALDNLINNAWKFTKNCSIANIEFGASQQDGKTVFFVRDNGVGFDMAYANKLFGAFQRLHSAAEFEGTGIGLATVQRIILRHGGNVWAEGFVNKGATFYFTLL
ncbi:MAG: ATP-binding protein [Candidatus Loosdrechtia sp.]|uniref:ATP-binding protein n=1 Tax=Candidatus Loosdrechtia sp. TaxID=3101272 RepID=UPI003A76E321|nr:MAG: cache domain-containing protein [Candidatus Jettenia sp. AMX2]